MFAHKIIFQKISLYHKNDDDSDEDEKSVKRVFNSVKWAGQELTIKLKEKVILMNNLFELFAVFYACSDIYQSKNIANGKRSGISV